MCWLPTSLGGVHTMWGMMGFMGLGMIFWVAILALVVYFIVRLFLRQAVHGEQSDALRILKEGYARAI